MHNGLATSATGQKFFCFSLVQKAPAPVSYIGCDWTPTINFVWPPVVLQLAVSFQIIIILLS